MLDICGEPLRMVFNSADILEAPLRGVQDGGTYPTDPSSEIEISF